MYIYGKNVLRETLNNKVKIKKAFVSKDFSDNNLLDDLEKVCKINYTDKRTLDKLTSGLHQGVVLEVPDYKYADITELVKENAFLIILDHIEDPHNFGAIIRTSEAAGIDGIIIPKDRSVEVNGTVMKTSAGTLDKMKIASVVNLNNTIDYLKKNGFWIVGTDMNGTCYTDIDYKGKIALIIGNEGKGMSRLIKENCDFIASIPMKGSVNSLNASVAASIIMFEAVKKRG